VKDPNEKRTLLVVVLCMAVLAIWQIFAPPPQEPAATEIASKPATEAPATASPATPSPSQVPAPAVPCTSAREALKRDPPQGGIATDGVIVEADSCRSGLARVAFPGASSAVEVTPWWQWVLNKFSGKDGGWTPYVQKPGVEELLGKDGAFAAAGFGPRESVGRWTVQREGSRLQMTRQGADGLQLTQVFEPGQNPWSWNVTVTWTATAQPVTGTAWVGVLDGFSDLEGTYDTQPFLAAVVDDDLEELRTPQKSEASQVLEGPVSWFGVSDRYFLAALRPAEPSWGAMRWEKLPGGLTAGVFARDNVTVAPGAPLQQRFALYTGTKDVERLVAEGGGLEEAADLGMFGFFAKVLLFFLRVFQAGVKNWGVSIVLLTLMIRVIFYPLTAKAFQSGKRMQALQPKLQEIRERHADDKNTQNTETMKLFQKHGVNPLGGCLPMLVQMPVFFALYAGLMHTPDLFHARFLFIQDLSAPDPYAVFPGLMVLGMVLQQRLTPMTGVDPDQARMMKFMPLLFGIFMFSVPAGLAVYYATNTLLSIAQQWYNQRNFQAPVLEDV